MKTKIKNRALIRLRKKLRRLGLIPLALLASLAALGAGCATGGYTPHVEIPRLVLQQPQQSHNCPDLDRAAILDIDLDFEPDPAPLSFVKHPLEELEADEAAAQHANPEREALEAIAGFKIIEFLRGWERP